MWFKLIRDFQEPVPNKTIRVLPSFNSILSSFRIFKCRHDISLRYLSPFHSTARMSVKFYHVLGVRSCILAFCGGRATILDQQHELQGMDGRRFEAKVLIKTARSIVLCVDKNRADTCDVGRLKRPQNGIFQ